MSELEFGFCPWCKTEKMARRRALCFNNLVCDDCYTPAEPDPEDIRISEAHEAYDNLMRGK